MAHLKVQGSTYHARFVIPKDVRHKFGNKTELWRSTETGDRRLAEIRCAEMVAQWKREVYSARNGVNVTEWTKSWAKELREASTTTTDETEPSDRKIAEDTFADELEDMVQGRRLTVPQAEAAFAVATGRRVILADYKDDYMAQYRTHSIKTQAAYKAAVERFLSQFPDDTYVIPKNLKQWAVKMVNEDELAGKTVTRMLGQARSFWAYLIDHEIVKGESTTKAMAALTTLAVPKNAAKQISIRPFTPAEVVAFLRSPVAQADAQLTLLIIIAMYSGARIEEIAMLKKSDLDFGNEVIHFRGTKTAAADREVPMHPVLVSTLSQAVATHSEAFVIDGLTIDKRGERGKAIGKRFGRLKIAAGFAGRDQVFHSIRKTVGTQFEQAEVLEGIAADILGHEKQTMTYGLYSGGSSMQQKRDAVNKLKYPAI